MVITDCLSTMNVNVMQIVLKDIIIVAFISEILSVWWRHEYEAYYKQDLSCRNTSQKCPKKTMIIVTSRVENFWPNREFQGFCFLNVFHWKPGMSLKTNEILWQPVNEVKDNYDIDKGTSVK